MPVIRGGECRVIGFGSGIEGLAKIRMVLFVEQAGFHKGLVKFGHNCLPCAAQSQEKRRLFSDNLADDLTGPGAGIKIDKNDLLPGAEGEFAINNWDGQRGAEQRCANV